MTVERGFDWLSWHQGYSQAGERTERLRTVQDMLRSVIPQDRPIRILSLFSGDSRDLIGIANLLPEGCHITLLERDPDLLAHAVEGLSGYEDVTHDARNVDATMPHAYDGVGSSDVILACGVFGHVPAEDHLALLDHIASLARPDAWLIWTRHRNSDVADHGAIEQRGRLAKVGYIPKRLDFTSENKYGIGLDRVPTVEPASTQTVAQIFRFEYAAVHSQGDSAPSSEQKEQ